VPKRCKLTTVPAADVGVHSNNLVAASESSEVDSHSDDTATTSAATSVDKAVLPNGDIEASVECSSE